MKDLKEIEDLIQQQMAAGLYPGASLAIYRNGGWEERYLGTTDGQEPVQKGLLYDLASVSKVLGVATLLIPLIQKGDLQLDQSLQAYLPNVREASLTIRQLVTHTSGIDPFIPQRDQLDRKGLKEAILEIGLKEDHSFHYTDLNVILLGFLLEEYYGAPLDQLFEEKIFGPWGMTHTSYGPVRGAVPTVKGIKDGQVHDPKARVLGPHTGSAGLFSTIEDLEIFVEHYLIDDFAADLATNLSWSKPRSIVWDLDEDGWISHTGYTGPFLALHRTKQQAIIFLTNRTFWEDDRPRWIAERTMLMEYCKHKI